MFQRGEQRGESFPIKAFTYSKKAERLNLQDVGQIYSLQAAIENGGVIVITSLMATCTQHSTATRDTLQNLHQRVSEERSHAGGTPLTKEPQCHRNNLKPQSCLSCRARLIHTSRFSSVQSQRPGLTGMMEFLVVFSNLNVSKASCRGGKGKKKKRSGVVTSAFLDQTMHKGQMG